MTPLGAAILLSPLPLLAALPFLKSRSARWLAALATPFALFCPALLWLAGDCAEDELAFTGCAHTAQPLADAFGALGLLAYVGWVIAGPVLLVAITACEVSARRA
ncbi:hypothetical protein [Vannielia litorea]|uniref:Uncharacterized protein n=1 Tax=Vannielia litorea TaxID=1217970 RepID=A0A1N6G2S3_9RHOB|nr:hypothetical protein [Vannielia litorea]SIO01866.1 hypothetical protein SAMN05444002_2160 [Vannielia litorea]